jgi:hypothetical protein
MRLFFGLGDLMDSAEFTPLRNGIQGTITGNSGLLFEKKEKSDKNAALSTLSV